jgi:hypothetical protein
MFTQQVCISDIAINDTLLTNIADYTRINSVFGSPLIGQSHSRPISNVEEKGS